MFTGIIEEIGVVKEFNQGKNSALIVVECKKVLSDTKIGDSISINGICQTVIELKGNSFSAQISNETLKVTTFSDIKKGQIVNLERALTLSTRLGGHMVTGHIDNKAKVSKIEKQADFYTLTFKLENESNLKTFVFVIRLPDNVNTDKFDIFYMFIKFSMLLM